MMAQGIHIVAWRKNAFVILLLLVITRLLAMIVLPLNDTTEARYGEIARKMLALSDWVTLWHDIGIPFWAKPPLSTWSGAAFMAIFGVSEWAVRLPALLVSGVIVYLIGALARDELGEAKGILAAVVLSSSFLFALAAGTVMTDQFLLLCMTLSQVSFWRVMVTNGKPRVVDPRRYTNMVLAVDTKKLMRWRYLFFIGLGLGLLAKGPVAVVLVGLPIGAWIFWRQAWRDVWQAFPWVTGFLLVFLIAAPWYMLAEYRTPGFLNYFVLGEHVGRFLNAGWQGDRYGSAHAEPIGMIWAFAALASFPWSLLIVFWLLRRAIQCVMNLGVCSFNVCIVEKVKRWTQRKEGSGWLSYVALWSLTSLVFFTFARNIIWTYCLPMLPGLALWIASIWGQHPVKVTSPPEGLVADVGHMGVVATINGLLVACIFGVLSVLSMGWPALTSNSQRAVMLAWKNQKPALDSELLYWSGDRLFSSAFYSNGRARLSKEPTRYQHLLDTAVVDFIVVPLKDQLELPTQVLHRFTEVGRFETRGGTTLLLQELGHPTHR